MKDNEINEDNEHMNLKEPCSGLGNPMVPILTGRVSPKSIY